MTPEQYQRQWSTLTGRPASQVYVPIALRPFDLKVGARVTYQGRDKEILGTVVALRPSGLAQVDWDDDTTSFEGIDENGRAM